MLVVTLLALWLFGEAAWYAGVPAATAPAGLHLAVLLFGLLGGATSALLAPGRGPALLRPVLGALAAQALYTLFASGTVALGQITPGAWLALSFAAGFAERLVIRAPAPGRG